MNPSREILIVGGEDHKTGQKNDGRERFARLEQSTLERFPEAGEVEFRRVYNGPANSDLSSM
jgi:hypothetical protein